MKSKEKPIFLSKAKKIDIIKNISVNLKCIKSQKIKLNNKINQNIKNKKLDSNFVIPNNILNKTNINDNKEKIINIINIEKKQYTKKNNQKRSKSTKSFSVNNSNKSNIKRNFVIKKSSKNAVKNKSNNSKTTNNTRNKKREFYKKININISKNNSNKKRRNTTSINKLSPINHQKKLIQNNAEITPNNPMELTFGSSSFISNNIQTETNETENRKISIQEKTKKKKNNSFIKTFNSKNFKNKKNANIGKIKPNKIVKLNKKLLLKPSWKIKPSLIRYKPLQSNYNKEKEKEKEKSRDNKTNKSAFIIENYNKKNRYSNNVNIDRNFYNLTNITDIHNSKSFIKDNKSINRNKKSNSRGKSLKLKYTTFYNKNLLRNKLFKKKKENGNKNNFEPKNIIIKNYSLNNSSFYKINIINNRELSHKNKDKMDETKECIIKINKSVDKEKGKYKLIIKRTNKVIKRMPKSTPKLLLTHPSFKNLFF